MILYKNFRYQELFDSVSGLLTGRISPEAEPELPDRLAGELVEQGIKGFWNFSHYDLSVEYPDVTVENVHLGDSLMSLGYRLRNQEK